MRSEHAPVHVRLVDDDEGQVREQLGPGWMVGQDPDVEHVRIGEHQVRALADRGALAPRRVAVVDRGPDLLVQPERVEGPRLVLSECLGRIEVERPGGAIRGQDLKCGELEAQRFTRRRARGDDRRRLERAVQRVGLV